LEIVAWYGQSLDNKPYLAVDNTGNLYTSDPEDYRVPSDKGGLSISLVITVPVRMASTSLLASFQMGTVACGSLMQAMVALCISVYHHHNQALIDLKVYSLIFVSLPLLVIQSQYIINVTLDRLCSSNLG
jgi:hypothetical protein